MDDPLLSWAETAAKLRFGPHAVLREDDTKKAIFLEAPGAAPRALGSGPTWPDAMIDAVKHNPDIPQPPPAPMGPETAPEGDEFIEEFVGAMRRRDLLSEFLLWYGQKADQDPESYPRALHRGEWLEQLGAFIGGVTE